jgi:hypothetical protein
VLKLGDFTSSPEKRVLLDQETMKRYFAAYEKELNTPFLLDEKKPLLAPPLLPPGQALGAGAARRRALGAGPAAMLIAVAYDIPDNRRRTHLAQVLEDFGRRVLGFRLRVPVDGRPDGGDATADPRRDRRAGRRRVDLPDLRRGRTAG